MTPLDNALSLLNDNASTPMPAAAPSNLDNALSILNANGAPTVQPIKRAIPPMDLRPIEERPALVNQNIQAQGVKYNANMTPPTSLMNPRYPTYARNQAQADAFDAISGLAMPIAGAELAPGARSLQWAARNLMQRALKPTTKDLLTGKAGRAAQTFLETGTNVTPGGIASLRETGTNLGGQVENILSSSTATIPKTAPAAPILDEISNVERTNPLPNAQRNALEGVYNEYASNPLIPQNIPLSAAQLYKQSLYRGLKDEYGTLSVGDELARKALARGLRQQIETQAPGVIPLNQQASGIWNAVNVGERRALLSQNNNLMGLSLLAKSPGYQSLFLLDRSPLAQSMLARALYNSQRVPGAVLGGGVGALMQFPRGALTQ